MRIIYTSCFPPKGYWAINICGLIFARKEHGRLNDKAKNHEFIHTLQQRELLYLFFYLFYFAEWLYGLIRFRNWTKAYYHISFEREAYAMEYDLDYPSHRRCYSWIKYTGKAKHSSR